MIEHDNYIIIIDNLQLQSQRWSCQEIIPAQWGPIPHLGQYFYQQKGPSRSLLLLFTLFFQTTIRGSDIKLYFTKYFQSAILLILF